MERLFRRAALLCTTAALSLTMTLPSAATVYLDVTSSDWYAPAAAFGVSMGLFTAAAPNRFCPERPMTRAMFYTVLSRAACADVDDATASNLEDVPAGSWYTGSVIWAVSSGLADCRADDRFGAYESVSRAELCLALQRFDRLFGLGALPEGAVCTFPDLAQTDEETRAAIAACQAAGVIQGRSSGLFDPHAAASRAETAQILFQYFQLPQAPALAETGQSLEPLDQVTGWTGSAALDFPLGQLEHVTAEQVLLLNKRILQQNQPASVAPYGTSLDGNPKHLTNYGDGGLHDCCRLETILYNRNNQLEAGVALAGRQEYYGYSLQTSGVLCQDRWHQAAQLSGKDPWQCTWWVWGRAAQYLESAHGLDLTAFCGGRDNLGHGKDYYRNLSPYFLSDQTPSANSIISWSAGSYGHVAYVEAVEEGGIWVSMADSGHTWRGITYIPRSDDPKNPYPLNWYPQESLNGFNHLDYTADGTPIV